jgi:hypothetical protein
MARKPLYLLIYDNINLRKRYIHFKIETMKYSPILILTLLIVSCGLNKNAQLNSSNTIVLGDTVTIYPNITYSLANDEAFTISVDTVLSDSRCPEGKQCIWEGNAEIVFLVTFQQRSEKTHLNSAPDLTHEATVQGYQISLLEVTPAAREKMIYLDEYAFKVLVNDVKFKRN